MKARLVFKTSDNSIVTRDINIDPSFVGTHGIYDANTEYLFQLEVVGIQWLPDTFNFDQEPKSSRKKHPL